MGIPRPPDAYFPEDGRLDRAFSDVYSYMAEAAGLTRDDVQAMIDAAVEEIVFPDTGPEYTDRGDPASVDFDETDLTLDATWRTLDLSSIIDEGAVLVLIRGYIADTSADDYVLLRTPGNSNEENVAKLRTGVELDMATDLWVTPDEDGTVEYKGNSGGSPDIRLTVGGWWA